MADRAAPPRASGDEQPPAPQKALPAAGLGASPRPWLMRIVRQPLTENVYFIQIDDANGNKVAALSTHASVGGRGVEQGLADAKLIVALVNSPAAAAFEGEARHAAPAEIPEADRPTTPAMERLL